MNILAMSSDIKLLLAVAVLFVIMMAAVEIFGIGPHDGEDGE